MPLTSTSLPNAIIQALAPGVALTSVMIFNNSLQTRLNYLADRIIALSTEARAIGPAPLDRAADRLASVQGQIEALVARIRFVRFSIMLVYAGFLCFILTIVSLLALALEHTPHGRHFSVVMFAAGFVLLVVAVLISSYELQLGQRTLEEDVRSSLPR